MKRRVVSTAAVAVLLPLLLVTAPIWLVVAVVADGIGRLWRFPTVRLGLFTLVYLAHQWAGMTAALGLWLTETLTRRPRLNGYRRVQAWWAGSLLTYAKRLLGVTIEFDDPPPLPDGRFVLMSRHASMVDAVVPITLVPGRFVHYVLKDELLWDPAIGTFGTKLGNQFVARGSRTSADVAGVAKLAADAQPDSALVIFPEGTYATPKTRSRVLASLKGKVERGELGGDVLEQANKLEYLLPPKPAGALAMLSNRPEADVVVVGHVGLEGVAELKGLRSRLPLVHPVVVRWWNYKRSELPTSAEELEDWLQHRWVELDKWVSDVLADRQPRPSTSLDTGLS